MTRAIDLDDDGDIDVVSAAWDEKVTWYRNDGGSNFEAIIIVQSEYGSRSVDVVDIDGDDDLDILFQCKVW